MNVGQRIHTALGIDADECHLPDGRRIPRVEPRDEVQAAELLRLCGAEGWTALPVGCGSKLGLRPLPEKLDLALSTRALEGIVAHEPDDGTITVRAGTGWSDLAGLVGTAGDHLIPTPAGPTNATVGGVYVAADPGVAPIAGFGTRDQVLGMRMLLTDGRAVTSGGRLVKNVTGYDLHRLVIGSHGTLALVTELSLRVHPGSAPAQEPADRAVAERSGAVDATAARIMARIEDALDPGRVLPKGRLFAREAVR